MSKKPQDETRRGKQTTVADSGVEDFDAAAAYRTATLMQERGDHAGASVLLRKVIGAQPRDIWPRTALAVSFKALRRPEEAIAQYEAVTDIEPSHAGVWNNLGNLYVDLMRHDDAERSFLRAIELAPDFALAHANLGGVYTEQGRQEDAITAFRKAIEIDPLYVKAHYHLAFTKRHTQIDDEIRAMEALYLHPALADEGRSRIGFGLGKAYEELGRYPEAFAFFTEANRLKHTLDAVPLQLALTELEAIRDTRLDYFAVGDHRAGVTPVFVVGMPRSGTSLTESILSNHSQIFGAGELTTVRDITVRAVPNFPRDLEKLGEHQWRELGDAYIESVGSLSGGAAYVVDKMPANFLHIGIIRKMLPNAKIVHCRRDPIDTCLSCFKASFLDPKLAYTGDLEEVGTYYRQYALLMEQWNRIFPGWIHATDYESLVGDPAGTVRALLDAIGLEFEESCLAFHESNHVVATASAMQVRQPIHGNSVRAWKRYEKELQPLISAIGQGSR